MIEHTEHLKKEEYIHIGFECTKEMKGIKANYRIRFTKVNVAELTEEEINRSMSYGFYYQDGTLYGLYGKKVENQDQNKIISSLRSGSKPDILKPFDKFEAALKCFSTMLKNNFSTDQDKKADLKRKIIKRHQQEYKQQESTYDKSVVLEELAKPENADLISKKDYEMYKELLEDLEGEKREELKEAGVLEVFQGIVTNYESSNM